MHQLNFVVRLKLKQRFLKFEVKTKIFKDLFQSKYMIIYANYTADIKKSFTVL